MIDATQSDRQDLPNRGNLARREFAEKIRELNAIQTAISTNCGEVAAAYDEIETFVEVRLDRIKKARRMMREGQKNSRRIAGQLAEISPQVLGD